MKYKSLTVYYATALIPKSYPSPRAFRKAAMAFIEGALASELPDVWGDPDSNINAESFSFEVDDFDRAEAIIRKAVKGTDFENIRAFTRYDSAADEV